MIKFVLGCFAMMISFAVLLNEVCKMGEEYIKSFDESEDD